MGGGWVRRRRRRRGEGAQAPGGRLQRGGWQGQKEYMNKVHSDARLVLGNRCLQKLGCKVSLYCLGQLHYTHS